MRLSPIIPEAETHGFRNASVANFDDISEDKIISNTDSEQPPAKNSQHSEKHPESPTSPSSEEQQRIRDKAHSEGYAAGYKEGFDSGFNDGSAKAQQELGVQAQRMRQLVQQLQGALESMDQEVETELSELASLIAKQVLQRELTLNPESIITAVQRGISMLPGASRFLYIHLHTDDMAMVRNALEEDQTQHHWKLIEDPEMTPGSCLLETDHSQLDLDLQKRLIEVTNLAIGHSE